MNRFAAYARGLALFAAGVFVGGSAMRPASAQGNAATGLRLNHVGIAVTDFQKSLDFYTKVMGFRVAYAFPSPDGKPTTTFLQVNRDTFIEMAPATDRLPAGITHFGIWTDDANATVAQIRQNGGMLNDPRSGGPSGSVLSNITDPNGIRIEINQQPAGSYMRKAMDSWK
jgi:catechol 2,3-dioxygenase-like lactoylglutathione lyase family enzyme